MSYMYCTYYFICRHSYVANMMITTIVRILVWHLNLIDCVTHYMRAEISSIDLTCRAMDLSGVSYIAIVK